MHFSPTMQSTRRWGELCTCLPRDGMKSLQLEFELKLGNFGSLTPWPCQITLSILLMNCKLSLVWWFPNSKWAHCFLPVWTPYSIPRSLLSEYNPPVCPQSLKEVSRLPSSSCITSLLTSDTCDTAEAFKSKPKMHLVVYSLNTPGATVLPLSFRQVGLSECYCIVYCYCYSEWICRAHSYSSCLSLHEVAITCHISLALRLPAVPQAQLFAFLPLSLLFLLLVRTLGAHLWWYWYWAIQMTLTWLD